MSSVSVTSKGQVTIPKHIRDQLGINAGSQVEFELVNGKARMHLVRKGPKSRVEDGPAILDYAGPRIPTRDLDGATGMKKAASRARR
jgi:AbrB family looped-hinge helix DNA binding protein